MRMHINQIRQRMQQREHAKLFKKLTHTQKQIEQAAGFSARALPSIIDNLNNLLKKLFKGD